MAAFLERFGIFARSPDARPLAEIAADIDDELAFHVEESTRALAAEGLDAQSARAEALRRFGDYGRIRRECARTLMGERIMLQRVQLVLTAVLVVAVGLMLWSNREASATLAAERQASAELLSRLEAQIARVSASAIPPAGAGDRELPGLEGAGATDRKPIVAADHPEQAASVVELDRGTGYLAPDGKEASLEIARDLWSEAFGAQAMSWRHGLRMAERLAALPGSQGAEILAEIWKWLSVEHREQVMKPFVFGGGHANALEVLELGFDDDQSSVKERAVQYLHTYAWKNLWRGEATGTAWFAQYRDQPVAEVIRENATRWARELGGVRAQNQFIIEHDVGELLAATGGVRTEAIAAAGVDLAAILAANDVCAIQREDLVDLTPASRAAAERVLGWCAK